MKSAFLRAVSIGVTEDLSDQRRLAIQIGTLDAYWSFFCAFIFLLVGYFHKSPDLVLVHAASMVAYIIGMWLLVQRKYDLARFFVHCTCIVEVYLTVDSYPVMSGVDLFYFPTMMIPFLTFSIDEQWKGNIQIALACFAYILQQYLGIGYFLPVMEKTPVDKMISIVLVVSYVPLILGTLRWQVKVTKDKLISQQENLLHASTMKVLGEMSVQIAHEINNPLQKLSLQMNVLNDKGSIPESDMNCIKETIQSMGKMIQGLKKLGENGAVPAEEFYFSKVLEDVLVLSSDKIKEAGIQVFINGDTELKVLGRSSQISQVLINLLSKAIHSMQMADEKWIKIDLVEKNHFLQISFSTKSTSSFYELDLETSKGIVEKNKGSMFFDKTAPSSKLVILLPLTGKI